MLNICLFCFFVAMVTGVTCCSIFICCDLLGFFNYPFILGLSRFIFVSLSLSFNHIILICSCMISVCFSFCIHTLILLHIIKVLQLKQFILLVSCVRMWKLSVVLFWAIFYQQIWMAYVPVLLTSITFPLGSGHPSPGVPWPLP